MKNNSVQKIGHDICTGCMMCADICPIKAISFPISKGFWYPEVCEDLCVDCGLCAKKCPALREAPVTAETPIACFGVKSRNEQIRWHSTSGGFFSELAKSWMSERGFCAGAVYGDDQEIIHSLESDIESIKSLRQSKYVQSNTQGIYKLVKSKLLTGSKVLFCGTPCQIEAMYAYLGKKYDNLMTMDFVCLGICSPFVYRKYLDMLEYKYKSKIVKVWFKNKTEGWRSIGTYIQFANGKQYFRTGSSDLFMIAFVSDALSMRKSCQNCQYRKVPHNSDFTVADFWGIEKINPSMDDNRGLSAVMVNTLKGKIWFDKIVPNLDSFETTVSDIVSGNFSVLKPMASNVKSDEFMQYLVAHSLKQAMNKYSSFRGLKRMSQKYRRYKLQLKRFIMLCVNTVKITFVDE